MKYRIHILYEDIKNQSEYMINIISSKFMEHFLLGFFLEQTKQH